MHEKENKKEKKVGYLKYLGILLLLSSLTVIFFTFFPIISTYVKYRLNPQPIKKIEVKIVEEDKEITKEIEKDTTIVFVDKDFGLYIPKIGANAKVVKNVNQYNEDEYINALYTGVAHAKDSSTPDRNGNVFLFAHSAVNFYERHKYNVYFYLLGELEKDDPIYVSYEGNIYTYKVLESKKVNPTQMEYLGTYLDEDTLTIMTCWPAGMDYKRMIVTSVRDNTE